MKKFEDYCSDIQYAVSIKENSAYLCLHFTKDHEGTRINTPYPEESIHRIQDIIVSLVGPAGDLWDQRVRSQLIGKDLVSGLLVYELPLSSAANRWFKKDCIGSITTWENLVEKFVQKFYQLFDNNEETEVDEDDDPYDIAEIFKIEDNLFDFETPLCKAFNEFNDLLKIDTDLFTFDIQEIKTYEEYEIDIEIFINLTDDLKNHDIDGFCNGRELTGMVRVGCMTYFQDHKWYDELTDGKLKKEALMHKARIKDSWGDATPGVMILCAWLKISFEKFHDLDSDVLVKLEECWWKLNAHENVPFVRWENHGQGPYANALTEKDYDPYLDHNRIFSRNYEANNA
ncbi:hypothetical protein Tco_0580783, partial [Tanacetum coccineum]